MTLELDLTCRRRSRAAGVAVSSCARAQPGHAAAIARCIESNVPRRLLDRLRQARCGRGRRGSCVARGGASPCGTAARRCGASRWRCRVRAIVSPVARHASTSCRLRRRRPRHPEFRYPAVPAGDRLRSRRRASSAAGATCRPTTAQRGARVRSGAEAAAVVSSGGDRARLPGARAQRTPRTR